MEVEEKTYETLKNIASQNKIDEEEIIYEFKTNFNKIKEKADIDDSEAETFALRKTMLDPPPSHVTRKKRGLKREKVEQCLTERYVNNNFNSNNYEQKRVSYRLSYYTRQEYGITVGISEYLLKSEWGCVIPHLIGEFGEGWMQWSTNYIPSEYSIGEWRWDNLKEEVYERDKGICVECGNNGAEHIDHVIPRCLGGETTLENLITLCKGCHEEEYSWVENRKTCSFEN